MMEREINLLPPQVVRTRAVRIYLDRSGHLIRFLVFLAGLLLIVLGAVYVVVWRTHQSTVSSTQQEDERQKALLAQVRKVNDQVGALKSWQTENVAWTPRVPAVVAAAPADILLTRLSVAIETPVLEVGGTFGRRESVVVFQRQLEALAWVATVESPLSNFATGSESRFTLLIHPKP